MIVFITIVSLLLFVIIASYILALAPDPFNSTWDAKNFHKIFLCVCIMGIMWSLGTVYLIKLL